MLVKTMKMRWDELAVYAVLDIGAFLFGTILLGILTWIGKGDPEYTVFRVGTAAALVTFCFSSILFGMFGMEAYFSWHVGFGKTRKSFFLCDMAVEFCFNMINLIVIWILYFIEGGILEYFYAAFPEERFMSGMFRFWMFPLGAFGLMIIKELTGSLMMRFGSKAFWLIWVFWMAVCLLPGRIREWLKMNESGMLERAVREMEAWFAGMTEEVWAVLGVLFAAAALTLSWIFIRKHAVKGM